MPGRRWQSERSRYGFNGKEGDDEVKGNENQYDYGFRIYDPRIGRFLSVDPLFKSYPWYTPYQFTGNNPIAFIDLDGLEEKKPSIRKNVLIVIASEEEIKSMSKSGPMGSFHVILSTNVVDANKQFQKYRGKENVDNVVIRTHGNERGGDMDLDPKSTNNITDNELFTYNANPTNGTASRHLKEDYYKQVKALDEITEGINDDGNLIITACWGGTGVEGVSLGTELNKMSEGKINIFLNQDRSTRRTLQDAIQVYRGENTGLTTPENLSDGWVKINRDGTQVDLKDKKKGVDGNIVLDSRQGQNPIKIK